MLTLTITSFSVMPCFLPYLHSANDNGGDGGVAVKEAADAGNGATCSTTNSGNGRMCGIAILGGAADGQDANGASKRNNGGIAVGHDSNANNCGVEVNGGTTYVGRYVAVGQVCVNKP
jgi:hypothetical protein